MNSMQYRQPIKWGLIIVSFIFLFPLGFYFLVNEYKKKRNLEDYGKMLKTTGIVCIGVGIFYILFMLLVPLTSADGSVTTLTERLGLGMMMFIVFSSIGTAFLLNGSKKLKQTDKLHMAADQNTSLQQELLYESLHPNIEASCPGCGAHIHVRKGIATQCEYCGNEIVI